MGLGWDWDWEIHKNSFKKIQKLENATKRTKIQRNRTKIGQFGARRVRGTCLEGSRTQKKSKKGPNLGFGPILVHFGPLYILLIHRPSGYYLYAKVYESLYVFARQAAKPIGVSLLHAPGSSLARAQHTLERLLKKGHQAI